MRTAPCENGRAFRPGAAGGLLRQAAPNESAAWAVYRVRFPADSLRNHKGGQHSLCCLRRRLPSQAAQRIIEGSGMQLQLPWPPTVNSYYGGGMHGRRYVTHKGKAYCEAVVDICEQHNVQQITHSVAAIAHMHPPDKRTRDCDNYWKALLDAMTAGRVWDDDSRVRLQIGEMLDPVRGGLVVVTVINYDGDAAHGLRAMLAGIAESEAEPWEV